ncbi:hypothetical protein GIB67_014394, partial [Kingdonia uniflora]
PRRIQTKAIITYTIFNLGRNPLKDQNHPRQARRIYYHLGLQEEKKTKKSLKLNPKFIHFL